MQLSFHFSQTRHVLKKCRILRLLQAFREGTGRGDGFFPSFSRRILSQYATCFRIDSFCETMDSVSFSLFFAIIPMSHLISGKTALPRRISGMTLAKRLPLWDSPGETMRQLRIRPALYSFNNCVDFIHEFAIGKGDCILTGKGIFNPYFGELDIGADVVFLEQYGTGGLSAATAEAVFAGMKSGCKRIVAIGDGAVFDLAKLCALKNATPVPDLFDRKFALEKDRELILVPTACGSGGEVTNIAALAPDSRRAGTWLAAEELYADAAVMIPQLLEGLPYAAFAASSLDALVHAAESFVSPRATPYTRLFARQAIETILRGYRIIARDGEMARVPLLGEFLAASNYAGISFGNAGLGAVHAMGHPVEEACRAPHGEAGSTLFTAVFEAYLEKKNSGSIVLLNRVLADALGCGAANPWSALRALLERIPGRRRLREYGIGEKDLADFAERALTRQGRLLADSFVPLTAGDMTAIYRAAY